MDKPTTPHVPITVHDSDNFGGKNFVVEHQDGTKKIFPAQEGEHEHVFSQAKEYRERNLPKMKKADLNGPKQHNMGSETFQDEQKEMPQSILDHVKRNARERLQEVMGQMKEDTVFEKAHQLEPGMSYAKLKEKEKK